MSTQREQDEAAMLAVLDRVYPYHEWGTQCAEGNGFRRGWQEGRKGLYQMCPTCKAQIGTENHGYVPADDAKYGRGEWWKPCLTCNRKGFVPANITIIGGPPCT